MKRVTEKLKSRAGASLLFAILVFLLCVLAGTAALTAAAANSGRYTHLEAEQQAYLAVSSAAKLFRDEFVNSKYTATAETVKENILSTGAEISTKNEVKNGAIEQADSAKSVDSTIPKKFDAYLKSAVEAKEFSSSVTTAPADFTVTFDKINVKVTCVASGYNLTFTFTLGNSYKTELTLVGTANSSAPDIKTEEDTATNTTTTTTTKTVTVTWQEENAIISQGRN